MANIPMSKIVELTKYNAKNMAVILHYRGNKAVCCMNLGKMKSLAVERICV